MKRTTPQVRIKNPSRKDFLFGPPFVIFVCLVVKNRFWRQSVHLGSTFSHRLHHLIIVVVSNFVNHRFVAYATEWVANSDLRKRKPEGSRLAVVEHSINLLRVHQQYALVYPF